MNECFNFSCFIHMNVNVSVCGDVCCLYEKNIHKNQLDRKEETRVRFGIMYVCVVLQQKMWEIEIKIDSMVTDSLGNGWLFSFLSIFLYLVEKK